MSRIQSVPPVRLTGALVVLASLVLAVGAVGLAGGAIGIHTLGETRIELEASHLPPLLTVPGEKVSLAYDVFCIPSGAGEDLDDGGGCRVTGFVFARAGVTGPFSELPLTPASTGGSGQLEVDLPEQLAASHSGFSYYAVLRGDPGAASLTVPAGGAAAPLFSLPLEEPTRIDLGRHLFGATRRPDERVAAAAWGTGPAQVGLEPGRRAAPIGASAFDVGRNGTVYLLDETRHRVLVWRKGSSAPARVPLGVAGTLADMTVAPDDTIYVLETVAQPGRTPIVRRFDSDGRELDAVDTAERTVSQIRPGPMGPIILEQPAQQWMPVVVDGVPAGPNVQRGLAHSGRPLRDGREVYVLRRGNEIRVALVDSHGARRGWILTSDTDVAEVQIAEPVGDRLLLVARMYTEDQDEFTVLLLEGRRLVRSFSVDAMDWAESAPLGRFKLVGSSLYRLGSTPAGAFVDRFDLEVQ